MQYLGGKTKLSPWLIEIFNKHRTNLDQWYIEPFCGGCNVIDKMEGNRIAIDSNFYLIAMWKALQGGWIPPENVSEEQYKHVRNNKEKYKPYIVGFVGFNSSFAGKWWGGYARRPPTNFTEVGKRVVVKQIQKMQEVKFHCLDALSISKFPSKSLIYCDPPYQRTTGFKDNSLDHGKFWQWADFLVNKGHKVFISEKEAPVGWEKVFEKSTNNYLNNRTLVERLYTK